MVLTDLNVEVTLLETNFLLYINNLGLSQGDLNYIGGCTCEVTVEHGSKVHIQCINLFVT